MLIVRRESWASDWLCRVKLRVWVDAAANSRQRVGSADETESPVTGETVDGSAGWVQSSAEETQGRTGTRLLLLLLQLLLLLLLSFIARHCWLGVRKSIQSVHWTIRCWCGYLSGARCRLAPNQQCQSTEGSFHQLLLHTISFNWPSVLEWLHMVPGHT